MNAIRPRRKQDHVFFTSGDLISHKNTDIILSYVRNNPFDSNGIELTNKDVEPSDELNGGEPTYLCCAPHCNKNFHSIFECEKHYNEYHLFQCNECSHVFPNEFLLDLHLQEAHDAYFYTLLQHKKTSYKCLVIDCKERFHSVNERFRHLQLAHGYPKWFRFHSRAKKRLEAIESDAAKHDSLHASAIVQRAAEQHGRTPMTMDLVGNDRKERRRLRKIERNKNIPCRYYHSKSGCRRGDSCIFLHDGTRNEELRNEASSDAEMDDLANQIDAKVKISVPKIISFGRRRR